MKVCDVTRTPFIRVPFLLCRSSATISNDDVTFPFATQRHRCPRENMEFRKLPLLKTHEARPRQVDALD